MTLQTEQIEKQDKEKKQGIYQTLVNRGIFDDPSILIDAVGMFGLDSTRLSSLYDSALAYQDTSSAITIADVANINASSLQKDINNIGSDSLHTDPGDLSKSIPIPVGGLGTGMPALTDEQENKRLKIQNDFYTTKTMLNLSDFTLDSMNEIKDWAGLGEKQEKTTASKIGTATVNVLDYLYPDILGDDIESRKSGKVGKDLYIPQQTQQYPTSVRPLNQKGRLNLMRGHIEISPSYNMNSILSNDKKTSLYDKYKGQKVTIVSNFGFNEQNSLITKDKYKIKKGLKDVPIVEGKTAGMTGDWEMTSVGGHSSAPGWRQIQSIGIDPNVVVIRTRDGVAHEVHISDLAINAQTYKESLADLPSSKDSKIGTKRLSGAKNQYYVLEENELGKMWSLKQGQVGM